MKIQMIDTRRGTQDGFTIQRFYSGQTYEIGDTLARHFISQGWARKV